MTQRTPCKWGGKIGAECTRANEKNVQDISDSIAYSSFLPDVKSTPHVYVSITTLVQAGACTADGPASLD